MTISSISLGFRFSKMAAKSIKPGLARMLLPSADGGLGLMLMSELGSVALYVREKVPYASLSIAGRVE